MNSELYEEKSRSGFNGLELLDIEALKTLLEIHSKKIEFHREERKMHFGALALVSVLFFITLALLNRGGPVFLYACAIALLLLCLIIPYVIVYFKYENRLRKMNSEYFKIFDAIQNNHPST